MHLLGRLYGLQLRYWDVFGERRCPGTESIIAVLGALGAEIDRESDVEDAIAARRRQLWSRVLDPVCVSRGGSGALRLRLPSEDADQRIHCRAVGEDGEERTWEAGLSEIEPLARGNLDGRSHVLKHLPLPDDLSIGYHRCAVDAGGQTADALIVAAPDATFAPPQDTAGWGAFLPLYALRSDTDWGVGDYTGLAALAEWIGDCGGDIVATLPLLPTGGAATSGPSPYSPVSRLFWSELFIDLNVVPELRQCPSADLLLRSPTARQRLSDLREADEVDYAGIAAVKRTLLIEIAEILFSGAADGERRRRLDRFVEHRPGVDEYARFRAALERHGRPWMSWPSALRGGEIADGEYDEKAYRSHLVGQWLAHEQLGEVAEQMRQHDMNLYLDLSLGAPGDSFDVWRYREQFASGASAGAPPDTFFMQGQNWGLPPTHPERGREHGYEYLRACLRHHLRAAGMLRIDHVMALHRLFWIPDGFPATEGVYVRYPAREQWAIVALESHRQQAVIVGEDLGTVPRAVRRAMRRNRAHRIFVLQTEIAEDRLPCLDPPPPDSIACMNTHDMPTFASYRQSGDLHDLAALGFLTDDLVGAESARREEKIRVLSEFLRYGNWLSSDEETSADAAKTEHTAMEVLRACLRFMSDSETAALVVNLEDLWLERLPQNVPGTSHERPNWRRRARFTLEDMMGSPEIASVFEEVDRRRREARGVAVGECEPQGCEQ